MLEIGSVLDGKYRVTDQIGRGGMSVVYLARNERANKTWAVKAVRKSGGEESSVALQGLIAETNLLKSLDHKALPGIADIIDDEEEFLIVMDYIPGESLDALLRDRLQDEGRAIPVDEVIAWGIQLCDVLQYLHTRPDPIIYRDMKPANVMRRPDGELCLVDFGAARVYRAGKREDTACLGTPGYAAPEQYGGRGQTTPRTDIYNLGATLHHLVTGRSPEEAPFYFPKITECRPELLGETPRELRGNLLGLEEILVKCTACDAGRRYRSCRELRRDLERAEELGAPCRKRLRRKMAAFAACLAAGLLLGGFSLGAMAMEGRTRERGYQYYLGEASATQVVSEKTASYAEAIALDPADEEAYLLLLAAMLSDNTFSLEEDAELTAILNSRSGGRADTNRTLLRTNGAGWVEFCYQLGLAYYYSYEGSDGKSQSVTYFQVVCSADMDSLDLGEYDGFKEAWQARAQILSTIGSAANRLGQGSASGDGEYSYGDYWEDLMALFESGAAGQDNVVTEMRLCSEIVVQIYGNAYNFKGDGVTQKAMEEALDAVEEELATLAITGTTAQELEAEIRENLSAARRMVSTAFGSTALN